MRRSKSFTRSAPRSAGRPASAARNSESCSSSAVSNFGGCSTSSSGLLRPLLDVEHPPKLLTALEEQLSEFRAALAGLPADRGADRVKDFERRMGADLADDLRHLRDVSSPTP